MSRRIPVTIIASRHTQTARHAAERVYFRSLTRDKIWRVLVATKYAVQVELWDGATLMIPKGRARQMGLQW